MFDPMAVMRQRIFGFVRTQLLISIEHFVIGAVPNGMDGESKSYLCGFTSMFEELLAIHVEDAAVLPFANVWLEHRCRVRTEGAIHEHFDIANMEHIVTKATAQTQLESLIQQFHR